MIAFVYVQHITNGRAPMHMYVTMMSVAYLNVIASHI